MTVDLERQGSGRLHVALGPVERWVVRGVAAAFIGGLYWFGSNVIGRLDTQGEAIQKLATGQAVTNAQITTLSTQLADVPALTRQMAETRVQVERNTQDIAELRKLRGLK